MCTKMYLYVVVAMLWTGNDLEMIVFMGSCAQKGGKWNETHKKSRFGEALFLTTSHLLVL